MEDDFPLIPRRRILRIGLMSLLCTLILWILFNLGAGVLSPGIGIAWAGLSVMMSLTHVLPILLVGLIVVQILWNPVFKFLSRAGMELPRSAMLTITLLSALPVLIAVMVLGKITFYYFPLPLALCLLISSVWMARRYSFDSNEPTQS